MAKARKLPSGNWHIEEYDYTDENGKKHTVPFTAATKAEVEYQAAKWRKEKPTRIKDSVRIIMKRYIAKCDFLSPTTKNSYDALLEYGFDSIKDLSVSTLTNEIVQNAINLEAKRKSEKTGKVISPKTVKNEWGLIASALKSECNLSFQVRLPKIQRKNETLPEPKEVLEKIIGTKIELPCLLAMWCGLRMSEIRGLKFSDYDEKTQTLSINRVMIDTKDGSVLSDYAKTNKSIRKVKLPDYITERITSFYGAILPLKSDFIVPLTRNQIYHYYSRIMKKNNLDISFHDLRHLFASVMLTKLQIPDKIVQESGGWSTDVVMKNVYSQTFAESRIEADRKRDEYFNELISQM